MTAPALITLAHGSRDPRSAATIQALVAETRKLRPDLRIEPAFLELSRPQIGLGDTAGDAAAVPGAVVGDDVGRTDQPGGLHGHQFRVARAQSDAVEGAPAHSCPHAIALTAAAAIALPPRRPVTTK